MICLSFVAYSQQQIKLAAGMMHQLTKLRNNYDWHLIPQLGVLQNRHQVWLGPVVLLAEIPAHENQGGRVNGALLQYRFQLSAKNTSSYTLFAEYKNQLQYIQEKWNSNYWDSSLNRYVDQQEESRERLWQTSLGLVLQRQLNESFYINTALSAGYYHSHLYTAEQVDAATFKAYRGYSNRGFNYQLALSAYLLLK